MATVTVNIVGDAASLQRALGQAGSQLDQFQAKARSIGDQATSIGRSMTIGVTLPIIAFGKAAFDAASDLAESMSKANTIFGENAGKIREWASTAATSFGQSKQQALESAASFGNMFQQLDIGSGIASEMSTKMVELASDFASFHNADITEVLEAQSAAFRGEYDALQRFVPTINAAAVETRAMADSGKENAAQLTAQEKAVATYELILEGAGAAAGDFARTQDGAANSLRTANAQITDAAASIGSILMPIVADVAGVVADLVSAFSELPQEVQAVALAAAGLVAAFGPVSFVFGALAKGVAGWVGIAQAIGSGFETIALKGMLAADAIKAMSVSQLALGGAMTLGLGALAAFVGYLAFSEGPYERAKQAAEEWGRKTVLAARSTGDELGALRAKQAQLTGTIDQLSAKQRDLSNAITEGQPGAQSYRGELENVSRALQDAQFKHEALKPRIAELKQQMLEAKAAEAARKAELQQVARGTKDLADASRDAINAIRDLASAQLGAAGGAIALEQANLNLEKAQREYDAAIRDHGPVSEEARQADINLRQAHLDVQAAADRAKDSQDDFNTAVSGGPEKIDSLIKKLQEERATFGDGNGVIADRIFKLLELRAALYGVDSAPRNFTVNVDGLGAAIQGVNDLKSGIDGLHDKTVYVSVKKGIDSFDGFG